MKRAEPTPDCLPHTLAFNSPYNGHIIVKGRKNLADFIRCTSEVRIKYKDALGNIARLAKHHMKHPVMYIGGYTICILACGFDIKSYTDETESYLSVVDEAVESGDIELVGLLASTMERSKNGRTLNTKFLFSNDYISRKEYTKDDKDFMDFLKLVYSGDSPGYDLQHQFNLDNTYSQEAFKRELYDHYNQKDSKKQLCDSIQYIIDNICRIVVAKGNAKCSQLSIRDDNTYYIMVQNGRTVCFGRNNMSSYFCGFRLKDPETSVYKNIIRLADPFMKTYTGVNEDIIFHPDDRNIHQSTLNVANPPRLCLYRHPPRSYDNYREEVEFIHDHMVNVICSGDEKETKLFANLLINPLMNPGALNGMCAVIIGDPGAGKSMLFSPLKTLLGDYAMFTPELSKMLTEFNAKLYGKVFCVLHEDDDGLGKARAYAALKTHISESNLTFNGKNISRFDGKNTCNFFFIANFGTSIAFAKGERRFAIFNATPRSFNANSEEHATYFRRLASYIGDTETYIAFLQLIKDKYYEPGYLYNPGIKSREMIARETEYQTVETKRLQDRFIEHIITNLDLPIGEEGGMRNEFIIEPGINMQRYIHVSEKRKKCKSSYLPGNIYNANVADKEGKITVPHRLEVSNSTGLLQHMMDHGLIKKNTVNIDVMIEQLVKHYGFHIRYSRRKGHRGLLKDLIFSSFGEMYYRYTSKHKDTGIPMINVYYEDVESLFVSAVLEWYEIYTECTGDPLNPDPIGFINWFMEHFSHSSKRDKKRYKGDVLKKRFVTYYVDRTVPMYRSTTEADRKLTRVDICDVDSVYYKSLFD